MRHSKVDEASQTAIYVPGEYEMMPYSLANIGYLLLDHEWLAQHPTASKWAHTE